MYVGKTIPNAQIRWEAQDNLKASLKPADHVFKIYNLFDKSKNAPKHTQRKVLEAY